jgi:4-amino-4-deoxy-L-arabinose transferase-like glycosyltransferase
VNPRAPTDFPGGRGVLAVCWTAAPAVFVCLMASTWIGHSDPGDAQVYEVVARHLAHDGRWLSLSYLPTIHPQFYEHLPLPFWLMAVVIRVLGEGALPAVFGLFSLGVVLLSGWTARKLAGEWAGLLAVLVLGTTLHFFKDAGHPLLDPLLLLLSTASATPVLLGKPTAKQWCLAAALAAGAVAVKGPFGVLPLAGAAVARAVVDRSPRLFWLGVAAGVASWVPTAALLLARPDWWKGYFLDQVLASATGDRTDGVLSNPLYPLKVIAGRFWPGMAFLPAALCVACGWPRAWAAWVAPIAPGRNVRRAAALLLLQAAFILAALCLPGRKVWHHTLVAYPSLAAAAGIGLGPRLQAWLSTARRIRFAAVGLCGLALAALTASLSGLHRLYLHPPCVVSAELAPPLAQLSPGQPVLVASEADEWDLVSALAAETTLVPWTTSRLDASTSQPPAHAALVREPLWVRGHPGWREVSRARGWVFATTQ